MKKYTIAAALTLTLFHETSALSQSIPHISITPSGPRQSIYVWNRDRCEYDYIPDAPARAFRRSDNKMVLIATQSENWSLIGRDFRTLRPSCQSLLRSSEYKNRGLGGMWIEATYTNDGTHIVALISQDLSEVTEQQGCNSLGTAGRCWLNEIIAAKSNNMGQTFEIPQSSDRIVATLGNIYPP